MTRTLERCSGLAATAFAGAHPRRREDAALYLAHVEGSAPLRRLAEETGRPVSSVHRAVRRVEAMRDDPLLDGLFDRLARAARDDAEAGSGTQAAADSHASSTAAERAAVVALAAPGAFLMVARGAERAGVFARSGDAGRPVALLPAPAAATLAARGWLRLASRTRVSARYVLTDAGRRSIAEDRERRNVTMDRRRRTEPEAASTPVGTAASSSDAPLIRLGTRKGPSGYPYLTRAEVAAGETLRALHAAGGGPALAAELEALGPGLADVAFRACCLQEGLETIERRLGWSARSAKIVLKIALQRMALRSRDASARDPLDVAMQHREC